MGKVLEDQAFNYYTLSRCNGWCILRFYELSKFPRFQQNVRCSPERSCVHHRIVVGDRVRIGRHHVGLKVLADLNFSLKVLRGPNNEKRVSGNYNRERNCTFSHFVPDLRMGNYSQQGCGSGCEYAHSDKSFSVTAQLFRVIAKKANITGVGKAIACYLPVYLFWGIIVTYIFPIIFGFE